MPVLHFVCEEKGYLWQVKPSHHSDCYFFWRGNKFSQLATLNLAKRILFLYGCKILQFNLGLSSHMQQLGLFAVHILKIAVPLKYYHYCYKKRYVEFGYY